MTKIWQTYTRFIVAATIVQENDKPERKCAWTQSSQLRSGQIYTFCVCVWCVITYIQLWFDTENNQTTVWHQAVCVLLHVLLLSNAVFFIIVFIWIFPFLDYYQCVTHVFFLYQLIALFTICAEKYKNIKVRAVIARKCNNTQEAAWVALPAGAGGAAPRRKQFFSQLSKNWRSRKKGTHTVYSEWVCARAEESQHGGQFSTTREKDTDHQDTKKNRMQNLGGGVGKCAVRPWSAKQVFLFIAL